MRPLNPLKFFENAYIPEPNSGCWLWIRALDISGYGSIPVGHTSRKNGNERANRFSWKLHKGEIPKGMLVLHRCDVPSCVNPDHLFLGTSKDNYDDMVAKGRKAKFDYTKVTKLSWDNVESIRRYKQEGRSGRELASQYGVSPALISMIGSRQRRQMGER